MVAHLALLNDDFVFLVVLEMKFHLLYDGGKIIFAQSLKKRKL